MASAQSARRQPEASRDARRAGAIGELAAQVSGACFEPSHAMEAQIKDALTRAVREPALLSADQRRPDAGHYARHVIYSDPAGRFTILAIVWDGGQFSVPHAHHTWCAYAVYDGDLEETLFAWDHERSEAKPLRTQARRTGYSCYAAAGLDQIHRLGNPGTKPAISIHVYGVERDCIATHVNRPVEVARTEG